MATSRREPHLDARTNRTARNMSPVLKDTEFDQGVRRARSVPNSPDRKLSQSPASRSTNPSRPSSSFNARTATSRSTSGSASSSIHGKTLHPSSSMPMRGKADKSSGTSLWPTSSKDINMGAKSPSTLQKSKLSSWPAVEKMKLSSSSLKLRTQKGTLGALAGGKSQVVSTAHTPGATAKKKTGAANSAPSIQRTKGVPTNPTEAPKIEEQEVELLMEFDEMESISTPSIEEHLQERLPDPVDVKYVDAIAYVRSQDDPNKTSFSQQKEKNEVAELVSEEQHKAKENEEENINVGTEVHVVKETTAETDLKEAADVTKLNEIVSETDLNEAGSETDIKEAVAEPELIVKEEARANTDKVMPPENNMGLVHKWKKDDERSNEVKEESRSNSAAERRSKFMALIGKFEKAQ